MKFPIYKEFLSWLGVVVPARGVHYLNGVLNYLSVGRWFRDRGLRVPLRVADRGPLYEFIATQVEEPVTYLEFGVFQGVSMGMWIKNLRNPENRFTGFDSFEGLPENWGYFTDKKRFDVQGKMPRFDDSRVQLVKGWFDQTLPTFLKDFHPHATLIIHLDADLYSSTIFALQQLRSYIQPGTILVFDEFFDREHEMKAFSEFLDDEKIKVECLAATRALSQTAFRVTIVPVAGAAI